MMQRVLVAAVVVLAMAGGVEAAWDKYCWDNGDEYGAYSYDQVSSGSNLIQYHSSNHDVKIFWYYNVPVSGMWGYMGQWGSCVCADTGGHYGAANDGDSGVFGVSPPSYQCFQLDYDGASGSPCILSVS